MSDSAVVVSDAKEPRGWRTAVSRVKETSLRYGILRRNQLVLAFASVPLTRIVSCPFLGRFFEYLENSTRYHYQTKLEDQTAMLDHSWDLNGSLFLGHIIRRPTLFLRSGALIR